MILTQMFTGTGAEKRSYLRPGIPMTGDNIVDYLSGGVKSRSGAKVTVDTALQTPPFWCGLSILSGDVSQFPLITYKRRNDGGKDRAENHPTYPILKHNTGDMTVNLWLMLMVNQAIAYGTGYSRIHRTKIGNVKSLEFIEYDRVKPVVSGRNIAYQIKDENGRETTARITFDDMFRLPGLMFKPAAGLSLVRYARNTIGRILAAEGYADDFYSNAGEPTGWFQHPGELSPEAQERFLKTVERRHSGSGNRHKFGIIEEGMTWLPSGISPKDALMIDALELGRKEVALFLNLPPHKLGDDSKINYNSLEQENQSYLDSGLGVWLSRIEHEANDKLFTEKQKRNERYFAEFLRDARLRADTKTRYEVYSIARATGIMSANECRAKENMNPYEGGDSYDNPNITTPDQQSNTDVEADSGRGSLPVGWSIAARNALCDVFGQLGTRMINDARKAARRPESFLSWLNGIEDEHRTVVCGKLEPLARWVAVENNADPERLIAQMTEWFFDIVREQLLRASECGRDQLIDSVTDAQPNIAAACRTLADELTNGEKNGT